MKKRFDKINQTICEGLAGQFMKANPFVIGNNCIASFIYNFAKTQFNHPFTWAGVKMKDMLFLAKNFDQVNFDNAEFDLAYDERRKRQYVKARIDGNIDIDYFHYFKTAGNDAVKDTKEKYFRRVARMKNARRRPLFILDVNPLAIDESLKRGVEEALDAGRAHVIYEKSGGKTKMVWLPEHSNCFVYPQLDYTYLVNMKYAVMQYLADQFKRNRRQA